MPAFNITSATTVPPMVMKHASYSLCDKAQGSRYPKVEFPVLQRPTKGRPAPSSPQTRILPPPRGVDPTSATQDILQRVQEAEYAPVRSSPPQQADQPRSCQFSFRSLANACSVAGESTSLPGSTASSPGRLQQSQEAFCCQTQDHPAGDTALAPPSQASRNDIPVIPQATRHIDTVERTSAIPQDSSKPHHFEEQREQAQHTLSSGIRNDSRKTRQRIDSTTSIDISSQKKRETKSANYIPRTPFASFLEQFKGDLWRIVYFHKHNHTLIQFARAMDEVFQVLYEDHKVKIEVTYPQWQTRKEQWDADWAIGNGGPSAETLEELQGLPTWLECHDGAVRPKARRSISVTGGMVHEDALVYSQWNGPQLARLAEMYQRHAPDLWEKIAHEVNKPWKVCEAKFLASRANPIANKCPQCERTFKRPTDLKRHTDSHLQGGFLCPAREGCPAFTRRDYLRNHLQNFHSWVMPKTLQKSGPEDAGQVHAEEQVHKGGQILEQNPNLHPAAAAPSKRPRPGDKGSIDPPAKRSKWSSAEDAALIRLRKSGEEWEDIGNKLPGRNGISCKTHYHKYLKTECNEDMQTRLEELYARLRPEFWESIAAVLGIPWRKCEAMHWVIGQNGMAREANIIPFAIAADAEPLEGRDLTSIGSPSVNGYPHDLAFTPVNTLSINSEQKSSEDDDEGGRIQNMLNPSDEEVRQSPQTTSSQFSSDEDIRPSGNISRAPVSRQSKKSPRSGTHARRRSSTSHTSKDGSRRPSRRLTRSPSSSPEITQKTRAFRAAYSTEEQHFIWYLRIDRGYLWPDLLDAFNARFSRNRGRRELSGLRCRYYRLLGQYGMPQVRMLRTADVVQRYGMRASLARAGECVTYPWLSGQYPNNAYGQVLDERRPR